MDLYWSYLSKYLKPANSGDVVCIKGLNVVMHASLLPSMGTSRYLIFRKNEMPKSFDSILNRQFWSYIIQDFWRYVNNNTIELIVFV